MKTEIYDIYHDESREDAYWHGFLFVPRSSKEYLLELLRKARKGANWEDHISFKDIKNRMGYNSPRVQLVESWITIGLASLQQQKFLKLRTPFFICGKSKQYYLKLDKPIKCKFVIFEERDNHKKMYNELTKMEKIEITLKMGFKGGIHKLFNEKEPIQIGNLFIAKFGHQQNLNEVLKKLARQIVKERRNYVSFMKGAKIIPQDSDHNKINQSQDPNDSYLLQLCDILLGGVRHHAYYDDLNNIKYRISRPCKMLLVDHDVNNYYRMKQSRFWNGFIFGKAWLENKEWQFDSLKLKEIMLSMNQLELPLTYAQKS
ncbi:MAG: hypothetical protein KBG30_14600 [Bacteroidales bacterium]|nr:hypothetical protein [Bacteroidales bacterium]